VGAILGGVALTVWWPVPRPANLVAWALLAFGLVSLMTWNASSLTTATGVYVALFIIVGAPGVVGETGLISFLQQAVRDGERGRIFGAFAMAANAGEAVGMIAAGSLAGALGQMTLLNAQGLLYRGAGALAMARLDADAQRCYTCYLRVALGAWLTRPIRALRRGSVSPEDPR
jgi:hypothetical protein